MKAGSLQLVLIISAVLIAAGLYFAPGQINNKPEISHDGHSHSVKGFDEKALLASAETGLNEESKSNLAHLKTALEQNSEKDTAVLDQMGRFWDRQGIPAAAAIWFEKKARVLSTEKSYLDAAYRYFDSFKMVEDSLLRSMLAGKAIENYQSVLEMNPDNLNAKTDLGAVYAEASPDPMKGIMMLREVVSANPDHEMAQYNLGMLSVKSGQLDKAIERFQKVAVINPSRADIHFFLGQIYFEQGDTAKAISSYEKFNKLSDNYEAVAQVGKLIEKLKGRAS